jgi:hypothetical protein
MVKDIDGLPVVGDQGRMLGVRVPGDVQPDAAGFVHPGRGGMSVVADDPLDMQPWLLPIEMGGTSKRGSVYELDETAVAAPLALRPDRPPHHLIEPGHSLLLANYRVALAATRPDWRAWR